MTLTAIYKTTTLVSLVILVGILLPNISLASDSDTLLKEVVISPSNATAAKTHAFTLTVGTKKWVVPIVQVKLWFKTRAGDDGSTILQLRPGAIYDYLNTNISPKVNTLGQNSRYIGTGSSIQLISGGSKGSIVDGVKTSLAIRTAFLSGKSSATVAMKEYRPDIFSLEDFKKLSFPNLLATGTSSFAGSPSNRIHNITVGTGKFNGVVIAPNENFSFNRYLGPVDEQNGYLPELVIKENVTTPEFGGGICQVSTTAFRAAMQSGLKITDRHNHSYPVSYYGPPGYDATVYQPNPDLRFTNDTGKPILIKTSIVGTKVNFEFWGTSDGRVVKINGPFTTEKKPDGSLTAAVAQIVTKAGKTIREDNFVSHYQPASKFPHVLKANGEKTP